MKKQKGFRRFIWPIVLLGMGFSIGVAVFNGEQSTVQIVHDVDYSELIAAHHEEMAEIQEDIDDMMAEAQSDLHISVPEVPEIVVNPKAPVVMVDTGGFSSVNRTNIGGVSGVIGSLGIAMIFVMAMMVVVDDMRGRRED